MLHSFAWIGKSGGFVASREAKRSNNSGRSWKTRGITFGIGAKKAIYYVETTDEVDKEKGPRR